MKDDKAIKNLKNNMNKFDGKLSSLSRDKLAQIICSGCDFYSPEKERLECGAFKILCLLIEREIITKEDINDL